MIGDVLAMMDYINKTRAEWSVKVAHFDGSGRRTLGDADVNITVHRGSSPERFYFEVQPIEGYTFLRYPVSPGGVIEDLASLNDGTFTSTHFRFIRAGRLSANGHSNVRVPFVVYGYRTAALSEIGGPVGPR